MLSCRYVPILRSYLLVHIVIPNIKPTIWLWELCLKVQTMQNNELYLLRAIAYSILLSLMLNARNYNRCVNYYYTVWSRLDHNTFSTIKHIIGYYIYYNMYTWNQRFFLISLMPSFWYPSRSTGLSRQNLFIIFTAVLNKQFINTMIGTWTCEGCFCLEI